MGTRHRLLVWAVVIGALVAGSIACGTSSEGEGASPTDQSPDSEDTDADDNPSKSDASKTDASSHADADSDAAKPPPGTPHAALSIAASCALLDDHSVKCWGYNNFGQLGLGDATSRGDAPNQMGDTLPAVDFGTGRSALSITAGWVHKCVVLDDHSVKCWGYNGSGRLGLGDAIHRGDGPNEMGNALPAVDLGTGRTALAVSAGGDHTCALLDDHSVKCWGDNERGQLGLGDVANRGDGPSEMGDSLPVVNLGTGRTALAVSAGMAHTCALLDDHSVKCWGYSQFGELGLGLANASTRGSAPNQMGDQLPAVDLGTGRTALAISAGNGSTCALLDDHSVKCWGNNGFGQLGLGDTSDRGDAPNEMGNALPAVGLGTGRTALAVSAGNNITCAVLDDHSVKCWGYNLFGELGLGDAVIRGNKPNQMGDKLPAVDVGTGRSSLAISGANFSSNGTSCVLLDDHSVKCWGLNGYGQLGLGDAVIRGNKPNQMGDKLPAVDLGKW